MPFKIKKNGKMKIRTRYMPDVSNLMNVEENLMKFIFPEG